MTLRKPCEHGRYDAHGGTKLDDSATWECPGGEFLAADALVIERLDDRELYRGVKRFISDWYDGALTVRQREGAG